MRIDLVFKIKRLQISDQKLCTVTIRILIENLTI